MVNDLDLLNANHALKQKCISVNLDNPTEAARAQHVIREMFRTLYGEPSGVALAAPQVGILLPIIVVDFEDRETKEKRQLALINPRIIQNSDELQEDQEICLSLPGRSGIVPRFQTITVEGFDHRFQAVTLNVEGYYARVLQHEIDHINGLLYVDRAKGEINHILEFPDRRTKATLKKLNLPDPL